MCSRDFEKMDGSDDHSVLAGAYADLGARRKGALIFFSVFIPCADKVFLVGSFNGWSETHPMSRVSRDVWRISLGEDEIADRDQYKYKVYRGGDESYITDPHAFEIDRAPYYNSVYRECVETEKPRRRQMKLSARSRGPFNIYGIWADMWLVGQCGGISNYEQLSRELLSYVLQMGYTHVAVSGILERYYDPFEQKYAEACFAPKIEQGGARALCRFVEAMHSASVGVLIDWRLGRVYGDIDADIAFFTENALYWLDNYGADGLIINNIGEYDREFLLKLIHNVKAERPLACFVSVSDKPNELACADIEVAASSVLCELFKGGVNRDMQLRIKASAMTYLLFERGRMLTLMGEETGRELDIGQPFDKRLLDDRGTARFQLFCSELGRTYLANPGIWESGDCTDILMHEDIGAVKILRRRTCDGELVFACDSGGDGGEVKISGGGEWTVVLDSNALLDTRSDARLQSACGETYLRLGAYGSVILRRLG